MVELPALWGAAAAALVLIVGWQPWRGGVERACGSPAAAFAPLVGALVALYTNAGSVAVPPAEYLDWVFVAALPAAGLGAWRGVRPAVALACFSVLALALAWLPTGTLRARYWGADTWLWVLALSASFTAAGLVDRAVLTHRPGWVGPWALALAALGSAVALGESGSGNAALVIAPLAAAGGIAGALALWRRDLAIGPALAPGFALLHAGLLALGVLYASLERLPALALLFAPLAALLPGERPRASALRLLAVAAIVAGAVAATLGAAGPPDPYGGY